MQFIKRAAVLIAALTTPLILQGCSNAFSTPHPGSLPTSPLAGHGIVDSSFQLDESVPKVAGQYDGTYSETIGVQTVHGTVAVTIVQSGKNITGKFDPKVDGIVFHLGITGTVKSGTHGAKLRFTIINFGGRNASAKAKVKGSKLIGTAYVPPAGTKKAVYIKYNTVKQ
jgi:hypothetical protein